MNNTLQGQVALVTGGNSGIGRGICLDLAKKGVKVMVAGRNTTKSQETKALIEEAQGFAEVYRLDVTDADNVHNMVQEIYKKYGRIDILVSNAGNTTGPLFTHNTPYEEWDNVLKTHLYGAFNCVKECAEIMQEKKYGRIVITSSLAGIHGLTAQSSYAVAKSGLVGLTYTLAKELGPSGITVNAVQPGFIDTPMTEQQLQMCGEQWKNETPMRRIGQPQDVATAVSFFCSPETEFITGVVMRVDGGFMLNLSVDTLLYKFASGEFGK